MTPRKAYPIELAGGTIWIDARALGAAFPADSYVGFTVDHGSLTFPHSLSGPADHLTYTGALAATLDVTPVEPAATGTACAAGPSR